MVARALPIAAALAVTLLAAGTGCEKTNAENLDKWMNTEKGPGKLKAAFTDGDLTPEMSAHAGTNMLRMSPSMEPDVRAGLDQMNPARRAEVVAAMAPRLWDIARIEQEDKYPRGGPKVIAKDALFMLRAYADEPTRQKIDGYLIDWLAVMSYEDRAAQGTFSGSVIMRAVGAPGGKRLINVLNGIIAAPGQDTKKARIGNELLTGMAASGNPDCVKYILQVTKMNRGDTTLPRRAMTALHEAYINPGQQAFEVQRPDAIIANLDGLVALAKDTAVAAEINDFAIELISHTGPEHCRTPLAGIIASPHYKDRFKYVVGAAALRCGGAKGIVEVVSAFPDAGAYAKEDLNTSITAEITRLGPKDQVLAALRELLGSKSTIARWVAIEALLALKSTEDAPKIAALDKVKDKLVGFWGDNPERKPDPSLGERARQAAAELSGK
ncbi:MAG: hypothetical protein KF773_20000 [Deltaproteobacteria bacterium]|nr:hypothetical protein [Deltaproteobacteria bacterium]MCW5808706.1 hypothetical protein [Deltaproteobacteria bacterium]